MENLYIDVCFADTRKAYRELGWKAEKTILEMCQDAWNYQMRNSEFDCPAESKDGGITATA